MYAGSLIFTLQIGRIMKTIYINWQQQRYLRLLSQPLRASRQSAGIKQRRVMLTITDFRR